jgi:NDP-sugar pyrophosphorylase family protein
MLHLITLSGNSQRFIDKGYPHKSLLDINGKSSLKEFIDLIEDFHDYESIFLCRNVDLKTTSLRNEIQNNSNGRILGIESNTQGPLYSVNQIIDHIPDDQELVITYIDSLQKTTLKTMLSEFTGCDSGLNIHDLTHPHWKFNKYFCLVKHDENNICTEVIEKYNFHGLDFDNVDKHKGIAGSSGSYYFKTGALYKKYSDFLLNNNITINNEFYITQVFGEMIKDRLKVKSFYCPYGNLGTPEDVNDYIFWKQWFS